MLKTKALIACALLSAAITAPAAAATVVNGSFETALQSPGGFTTFNAGSNDLTGWNITAGSIDYINKAYWASNDGNFSLDLSGNSAGTISQTINDLVQGQQYAVSFFMNANRDDAHSEVQSLTVSVDGISKVFNYNSKTNTTWLENTFTFTAGATSALLSFSSYQPDGTPFPISARGPALDSISIAPVPEPGEWAMLIAGLGVVGWVARKRQSRGMSAVA